MLSGSLTGVLAGLWQVAGHLVAALLWADTPQRMAMLTVAVLAVVVVGCLAVGASLAGMTVGFPVVAPGHGAAGEIVACRVPAPARPGRPRADQTQSTIGGPSGRLIPLLPAVLAGGRFQHPHPSQLEGHFLMTAVFGVPVDAAYHLVYALTTFLTPVLGGLAAVAGIVVFTMAIRLLVMPLSFRALRGQAAQARLAPQVQALRKRYGRQPERLQRELTALYRREGTSVFAGIVPLLAQWPVFSVLYLLFRSPAVAGGPNRLLSRDLFGVPLGDHWLSGVALACSAPRGRCSSASSRSWPSSAGCRCGSRGACRG